MTRSAGEAGPGAQPRRAAGRGRRARPRRGRARGGRGRARGDRAPAHRAVGRRSTCATSTATFALTNRLRTEGTDHLLAAGRAVGARRFVAQSFAGWPFARTGGPVKTEDDPLDPDPPAPLRATLEAIRHLERAVTGDRLGRGPRAALRRLLRPGHDAQPRPGRRAWSTPIRKRQFPIVGDGGGVWSFVHIEDAAAATVAAVEHGARRASTTSSTTSPRRSREWLPALASALGRQAAAARAALARPAAGRRGGDGHDDRGARRVEREGQARARLAAALPELAAGLRAGARLSDDRGRASRSCARRRSRSPTGCSAA